MPGRCWICRRTLTGPQTPCAGVDVLPCVGGPTPGALCWSGQQPERQRARRAQGAGFRGDAPAGATNDAGAGARFPSGLSRRARGATGRRCYRTERRSSSRTTSRHRTSRSPRSLSPYPHNRSSGGPVNSVTHLQIFPEFENVPENVLLYFSSTILLTRLLQL